MSPNLLRASFFVALALVGCASGATSRPTSASTSAGDEATEPTEPPVPDALAASAHAANDEARAWMIEAAAQPITATCTLAPVYFAWAYAWDEDAGEHRPSLESTLGPEARAVIDWDARCMAARGATSVELEGNVWSLGSDEYAMALGERLARTVREALVAAGVPAEGVETRSLGATAATGTDALGWTRDVRVDLR